MPINPSARLSRRIQLQQKLLKVLEEKTYCRVGDTKQRTSNFQLISATCDNIYQKVRNGRFRADLIFRINTVSLTIPPLRERKGDIPLLIEYFLTQSSRKVYIEQKAMELLRNNYWEGNVRDLKATVDTLNRKPNGIISARDIPKRIRNNETIIYDSPGGFLPENHHVYVKEHGLKKYRHKVEAEILKRVSEENADIGVRIEKHLQISHSSYYRLLDRTMEFYDLSKRRMKKRGAGKRNAGGLARSDT